MSTKEIATQAIRTAIERGQRKPTLEEYVEHNRLMRQRQKVHKDKMKRHRRKYPDLHKQTAKPDPSIPVMNWKVFTEMAAREEVKAMGVMGEWSVPDVELAEAVRAGEEGIDAFVYRDPGEYVFELRDGYVVRVIAHERARVASWALRVVTISG